MATKPDFKPRRPKKFAGGGGVREGQHEGIDDDTRARARKWVESQTSGAEATTKPMAKSEPTSKPAPKPMVKSETAPKRVGPTVEAAAAKRKADMPKGDWYNPVTSQDAEANKYRDRAIGFGTAAATMAAGPVGRAIAGRMASKVPKNTGRDVATKFDEITPAPKPAPKSKAKPKAKTTPKPAMSKRTKKFNDDEAGIEFKRGGAVKRGYGAARCK